MLACFNSMTPFRKTSEVLLDWYLNDRSFIGRKICAAGYDSSFSKNPWISLKETWGYDWSSGTLSAICWQTFPLSIVLALKWHGSVMRTSNTKARFWSSDHSTAELKVNKIKLSKLINERWRLVQDLNFLRHVQVYYKRRFLFSNNFYSSHLLNFSNTILICENSVPLKISRYSVTFVLKDSGLWFSVFVKTLNPKGLMAKKIRVSLERTPQ